MHQADRVNQDQVEQGSMAGRVSQDQGKVREAGRVRSSVKSCSAPPDLKQQETRTGPRYLTLESFLLEFSSDLHVKKWRIE